MALAYGGRLSASTARSASTDRGHLVTLIKAFRILFHSTVLCQMGSGCRTSNLRLSQESAVRNGDPPAA